MKTSLLLSLSLVCGLTLGLQACTTTAAGTDVAIAPQPGKVSDLAAFERFIAGKPTPEIFRSTYPDIVLILPGQIATKEFRQDNSRYFAELDAQGRIQGGRFM